jgi:GTP-binding protein
MSTQRDNLRNIAIIAHVDHGKTTLVDELLRQSGTLDSRAEVSDRMMDSNELEKERGITILSKNTAINWQQPGGGQEYRINIVDTPGHADFGGEVERILSMVDSVLLLVDAVEGPMPQTRFVTQKAFAMGFTPIVVINKIDRNGARPDWVIDQVFELFDRLGATDEQLDFPIIYASALNGYASNNDQDRSGDMVPLFEAIIEYVNPPRVEIDGPFQMQVSSLDYDSYKGVLGIGRITRGQVSRNYKGVLGIGRITRGQVSRNTAIKIVGADGKIRDGRMMQLFGFDGLQRVEVETAYAGDIIVFSGIDQIFISDTLCDRNQVEALPPLTVDEPTVSMTRTASF